MSLFNSNDTNQTAANKLKSLNPNAAEFVPFALRSPSVTGSSNSNVTNTFTTSGTISKPVLTRDESSISNTSDDEAHQFWRHQLPDDITPDFKVMNDDDSQGIGNLSLAGLSLHANNEASLFSGPTGKSYLFNDQQELSPQHINGSNFAEQFRYYSEDPTSGSFMHLPSKPWDKQVGHPYDANNGRGFINEILGDQQANMDEHEVNPVDFLASQFPGFASESLAEVYFANGCDLNLTIEMLTQLENTFQFPCKISSQSSHGNLYIVNERFTALCSLQVDGGFTQNLNSKTLSAPNLTSQDFPALSVSEGQNGLPKYAGDDLQTSNPFRPSDKENILMFKSSSSIPSHNATDFASAVRKLASQDSGIWKYERNGSAGSTVGSSRSSHVLASAYNSGGHGRSLYTDRLQHNRGGSARTAPIWLETGDAVANIYSELREEARDHARLRNAYFEQAREAFLIGNKALAKELSAKGQLHNVHMKAAHGKAQEAIYRQRNPVSLEMQGNGRAHERMIDLHGLHVSEALHVLKHELNVLRSAARSADQRLQVYICVGTGHHTRGSRTPARLPVAVQRYLLEEEGLEFNEPQPGLLRVVIY
ncbi:hypothetical protein ACFE04_014087 [Oxalis oulophora]